MTESALTIKKGDSFKQAFQLSNDVYQGFLETFRDRNPLHVSDAFARSKGFQGIVMHGNILGGFLSYFIGECLPMKNVIIHSLEMKFAKPVYSNDQLEFQAEVADIFESVHAFELKFSFLNKDHVKVARGTVQVGLV